MCSKGTLSLIQKKYIKNHNIRSKIFVSFLEDFRHVCLRKVTLYLQQLRFHKSKNSRSCFPGVKVRGCDHVHLQTFEWQCITDEVRN